MSLDECLMYVAEIFDQDLSGFIDRGEFFWLVEYVMVEAMIKHVEDEVAKGVAGAPEDSGAGGDDAGGEGGDPGGWGLVEGGGRGAGRGVRGAGRGVRRVGRPGRPGRPSRAGRARS